ncbi:hypothetical protein EBB59_04030 [Lysobacter pythonis]|uniref:Uncharacterized protein n=1 Tax=Solilutibacter pythonis TaxID=2483112 RepID=A0A3M2I3N2_9GAMM|nr:hypothetical protein [Lysobacter pythonis]RMH93822.1 hypothetical protein EBB59_04030 [Lysobacter pythonis]
MRSPTQQTGYVTIEYVIVLICAVVVLLAKPDVITQIVDAIKQIYSAFVYAISFSSIPSPV